MRWTLISVVVALLAAPASGVEISRAELVIDRGLRLVQDEHATERLRLNLRTGEYRIRSSGVEGRGRAPTVGQRLTDLLALGGSPTWPEEEWSPFVSGPKEDWRYVLQLYRGKSSKPARTLRGRLSKPLVSVTRDSPQHMAVLGALLQLREQGLARLSSKLLAADHARATRLPKLLFDTVSDPDVLLVRIEHEDAGPGEDEHVDAVQVFRDGRVELRRGTTQADLERRVRFRIPASRCKALAAALAGARPRIARPRAASTRRVIYAAPTLDQGPVVFSSEKNASWQAVDEALLKVLADLPLRGFFDSVALEPLNVRTVRFPDRVLLRRYSKFRERSPGHWANVGALVLDLTAIDQAVLEDLIATPGLVPVLLVGRYRLPTGQKRPRDKAPRFVVTEVQERPRHMTDAILDVQSGARVRLAPGQGQPRNTTVPHPKWLEKILQTSQPGDRLRADGWLRTFEPDQTELEIAHVSGVVTRHRTKTHNVSSGTRTGYGADLERGQSVRVTGALERRGRLFLKIGPPGGTTARVVNGSAVDLTPGSPEPKGDAVVLEVKSSIRQRLLEAGKK